MKTFILCLLIIAAGVFRTGCQTRAYAANVMLTHSYSFTIIDDLKITYIFPPNNATGIGRETNIEVQFTHSLPIKSVTLNVTIGGQPVAGTQTVTNITNGKKVIWTPSAPFPMLATVNWTLNVVVDNGL
jgi:uncharacterized protein YjdB